MGVKQRSSIIRVSDKFFDFINAESQVQRLPRTKILDLWLEKYIFPNVVKEKRGR